VGKQYRENAFDRRTMGLILSRIFPIDEAFQQASEDFARESGMTAPAQGAGKPCDPGRVCNQRRFSLNPRRTRRLINGDGSTDELAGRFQ
jgi:hypothetical protein